MAKTFYSDYPITLTVSNKKLVNSGVSGVEIVGLGDLNCDSTILGESNSTTGYDLNNTGIGSQNNTTVKFYFSPKSNTVTSASGGLKARVKWMGLDKTPNSADDTYTPYYEISDITVYNAVDSIYSQNTSYEVGLGDSVDIEYTLRGEYHNGSYLPIYNNSVLATVTGVLSSSDTINTGKYTFTAGDVEGICTLTLEAQGAYNKPSKTITINVKLLYFILDRSKLDSNAKLI